MAENIDYLGQKEYAKKSSASTALADSGTENGSATTATVVDGEDFTDLDIPF